VEGYQLKDITVPGLYGISRVLSNIEIKHMLRNPKPRHFKVVKNRGVFHRMIAGGDGMWQVQHRKVMSISFGPFATKQEAKEAIPQIVAQIKLYTGLAK
jgi:hypothetical protein